jgi:hypothetical protein
LIPSDTPSLRLITGPNTVSWNRNPDITFLLIKVRFFFDLRIWCSLLVARCSLLVARPDKTQIFDLLSYRGSTKNDEIIDFWFFGIARYWLVAAGFWLLPQAAGFSYEYLTLSQHPTLNTQHFFLPLPFPLHVQT